MVTSCMVTEEHINEVTCGGPKEAGIISAPLKKQSWLYSPDSRAETHTAGSVSEEKLATSHLSPGLDDFRFAVKCPMK